MTDNFGPIRGEREGTPVPDPKLKGIEVEIGPDDIRNNQDVVVDPFLSPTEKLLILGGKMQNPEWD